MLDNLELVIFDMDGLMFDTERRYCIASEEACAKEGIKIDIQVLYDAIGTYDPIDMRKLNQSNRSDEEIEAITNKSYWDAIEDMVTNGVPIKKGLYELMDKLESKNIRMCVATSTPIKISGRLLEKADVMKRLSFVVTGAEVEHGKPAPDIFLLACAKAGVSTDKALVLEDSIHGGRAAKAAGIRYIIVPDIKQPTADVAEGAYAVLNDLNGVADLIY